MWFKLGCGGETIAIDGNVVNYTFSVCLCMLNSDLTLYFYLKLFAIELYYTIVDCGYHDCIYDVIKYFIRFAFVYLLLTIWYRVIVCYYYRLWLS